MAPIPLIMQALAERLLGMHPQEESLCSQLDTLEPLAAVTTDFKAHNAAGVNGFKPFLKWVGGKSQIIDSICELMPKKIDNYFEPFLGGGSVLLLVLSMHYRGEIAIKGRIVASDINRDLINLYRHVRDVPASIVSEVGKLEAQYNRLDSMEYKKQQYYEIRDLYNARMGEVSIQRSAMFIFLNKTCFRGMYRCAKKTGHFNVSFGNYKSPTFICENNIHLVSKMIKPVAFVVSDFVDILAAGISHSTLPYANEMDFVYMDPPYVKLNDNSFVNYYKDGFSEEKHDTLFTILKSMKNQFMFSNSYTKEVLDHFLEERFIISVLPTYRRINSKHPNQKLDEVIVINYKPQARSSSVSE
jgi:DNA adenine methylase